MIALVLAAAVAASPPRLTPDELARAISGDIMVHSYEEQRDRLSADRQGLSEDFARRQHCILAQRALQISGDLLEAVGDGKLLVTSREFSDRIQPGTVYHLAPEDLPTVKAKARRFETDARIEKIACGS